MFRYPVNPALLDNRSKNQKNLSFVNEFIQVNNSAITPQQQLQSAIISQTHQFQFYCDKLNKILQAHDPSHDEKESFLE